MKYATAIETEKGLKVYRRHHALERAIFIANRDTTAKRPLGVYELVEDEPAKFIQLGVRPEKGSAKKQEKASESGTNGPVVVPPKEESLSQRLEITVKPQGRLGELAAKLEALALRFREIEKSQTDGDRQLAEVIASLGQVRKSA